MPTIRNFPSDNARGQQTTQLIIRRNFCSENFSYRFSQMEFIVTDAKDTLVIELVPGRHMKGYVIQIHEHCCTRPIAMKHVVDGIPESTPNYLPRQREATYMISLEPRELVQIGIIVRLFKGTKHIGDLLCDPQVGNGPPARNGFVLATPFVL